jgi:hypothetical protein
MIINKITVGFVIQEFNTETRKFVGQRFMAGDVVDYETKEGERVFGFSEYLPFDMVQPKE